MRLVFFAVAALLFAPCAARAQEKVDDPYFKNWSKFPKGTEVVSKQTTRLNIAPNVEQVIELMSRIKLVGVGAEEVVLEQHTESIKGGKPAQKFEPHRFEYTKTKALAKGEYFFATFSRSDKPPAESKEKRKVLGKEMETTRYDMRWDGTYSKMEGSIWVSNDVPGLKVLQRIVTYNAEGIVGTEIWVELIEIKKP